jgi:hypothetical protein
MRINFSDDLIIPPEVKKMSFLLLHVMSSWKFSEEQYEQVKKLISGEVQVDVPNRGKITDMVKVTETVYASHVLSIFVLYQPLLKKFTKKEGGFEILSNCKLSFLLFYLVKMMVKTCQIKISEISVENIELIAPWITQIIKSIVILEDSIFQEIFLNEFLILLESQQTTPQIWLMFLFEILKNFDLNNIRSKIWNVLFDTIMRFISETLSHRVRTNSTPKPNLQIFTEDAPEIIPQVNQFRHFGIRDNLESPQKNPSENKVSQEYHFEELPVSPLKAPFKTPFFQIFSQDHPNFRFLETDSIFEKMFDLIFSIVTDRFKVNVFSCSL